MFDRASRYAALDTATLQATGGDGAPRELRYVRRRFLPEVDDERTLVEHAVAQGDRLDNLTARYLGDPQQFWRVCDTNFALHPGELTDEVGEIVRITLPGV